MGKKSLDLSDVLYEYLLTVSLRESGVAKDLREETDQLEEGRMQIAADQGQFMALLLKLINGRRVIEIGTFTGYSALVMAQALPEDGQIIACDINEEWTATAASYWSRAGVDHKIDLRIAPALDTLDDLLKEGQAGRYDFAFIDADKINMQNYYERCLRLIRKGGLIAIDNVLWGGSVINPEAVDADTRAIRAFNECIHQDKRVEISLVPIGDGLTLARKNG